MNNYRQDQEKSFLFDAARRPASEALECVGRCELKPKRQSDHEVHSSRRPMINFATQKRQRSETTTFDMSAIGDASKKVERSITFPAIEWPTYEGEDETDAEDLPRPPTKRPRFGLVRSAPSFNLVALGSCERLQGDDGLY